MPMMRDIYMKAVIVIAGDATRMHPLTHSTAKVLLPVAGKSSLAHILDELGSIDISEFIFIINPRQGYQIEEFVKEQYGDLPVKFIVQDNQDGTACAVDLAREFMTEPSLIIFGDTIFNADLSTIRSCTDDGIIWGMAVEDYQRFGVLVHDNNNIITQMVEKPSEPISKLANIGMYFIKDTALMFEGVDHLLKNNMYL